jgi:hypothetical protein
LFGGARRLHLVRMKQLLAVCLAGWLGASLLPAAPSDAAIVAAVRLSDAPNYSWHSTVADDARTYDIDGRYVRGAYTHVRMPMVNSIRRKLGRDATDPHVEAIFRGNVRCVIRTDAGWRRPDELEDFEATQSDYERLANESLRAARTRRAKAGAKSGALPRDDEPKVYSNLQFAISPPHEELAVIVSSHATLEADTETASGTLSNLGAQLLLVRDGQHEITPIAASGSFKLWFRDGLVTRYQLKLEGTLSVQTPKGRTHVRVTQTSSTQIRDVGSTRFDVPAEAVARLDE